MSTKELVEEIERLPMAKRIRLLEDSLRSLRVKALRNDMTKASSALDHAYSTDKSLTAFTALDLETFYEAR